MTIDDYTSRMEKDSHRWYLSMPLHSRQAADQLTFEELIRRRLHLAQRVQHSIEKTKNSAGSSLNKSREEMDRLGEPVWERLQREMDREMNRFFDLYEGRLRKLMHLEEKMMDRTMTEKEYDAIRKGTHPHLRRESLLFRSVYSMAYLFMYDPGPSHPLP